MMLNPSLTLSPLFPFISLRTPQHTLCVRGACVVPCAKRMQNKQYDNNFNNVIMKKINYLAMLLAAGMFAACSDTLEDATGGTNTNTPATGEGYVKVAINMPTTSGASTRADNTEANDQFTNGIADEYAVGQDNWIVFFSGTSESDATIVGWSQLTSLGFSDANTDPSNITTTSEAVVEKVPLNTKYALVILNANGLLTQETTGEGEQATSTLKINSTAATNLASFTTALENQQLSNYIKGNNKYFLMSNAPIAKVGGGDSNLSTGQAVTTLVEVKVYDDEQEAQSAPSNQIYVERAVAKVTIANTFPKTISVEDNNPLKGSAIALQAWTLDNTNKSVKMVRDVTGWNSWVSIKNTTANKSDNRFFGKESDPFRVYWAIDGNYDATDTDDLKSIAAGTTSTDGWYTTVVDGSNNPTVAYCFENTFATTTDNNGELDDASKATRVLFKVKVTPNIKEDGTSVGSDETAAEDFILFGNTTAVYTKTTFVNYLKAYVLKDEETITINPSISAGQEYTTAESLYSTENENVPLFTAGVTSTNAQTVLNALGGNIRFYDDGVMFFHAATIKHFGEEYTKLKESALETNESYLGRYGVVRNNWYELNVNTVGIGLPVIPDDDEKLDEEEAYINCQINVLSWAKRSQSVDL